MTDNPFDKIDRTAFSVVRLEDSDNDLEYWLSKTPHERLAAQEYQRQMLYGYDPATSRIQNFFEVVEREED